jgi:predicted nucleotidyltransferase
VDFTLPGRVLCPRATAATIEVLAGTTEALTGRQIARLAKAGAPQSILDVLHRLVEHGLVSRQVIGKTHLYSLNRRHLAAPAVELLASIYAVLVEQLRSGLRAWEPKPRHASLFGSAARRDGTTGSDLDILLVRPKATGPDDPRWVEQKEALANEALAWSGNRVSWLDLSQAELRRAVREEDPLVDEVTRDGLHLAGTRFRPLLRELS